MSALRLPAAVWAGALAAAAVAFGVWLLGYFSDPRHMFLAVGELTTLREQASRAFAGGTPFLMRLWLLGPWLSFAAALVAALVAWRAARGSRLAVALAGALLLTPPVVYWLGLEALGKLEDRFYFEKSPWVVTFKGGMAVVAAVAVACAVWAAVVAWRARRAA